MPRAKTKTGGLFLGVSPWQDRQEDEGAHPTNQQPGYSVVELPLVVGVAPAAAAAAAAAGPASMPLDAQPAAQPNAPTAAPSGSWQAKKRKPAADEAQDGAAMTAEVGGGTCPRAAGPAAGAAGGEQLPAEAAQLELEGTAYLALLPNGNITGHLVCPPSIFRPGRRSLGIMAEAVLAGRECTRDADWGVLRFTLINFAAGAEAAAGGAPGAGGGAGGRGGAAEVSFLVERTEGDAMRLRAPVPWQGIELESLPQLDAPCTCASSAPGLSLDFRCQQLMEGPAADALLGRLQPSLVGQGALVNVGEMRLTLPAEAAAVLLPGHSSAGAGPQGRAGDMAAGAAARRLGGQAAAGGSGSGAQGGPTPPPRQQRITGGGGSGSGRVVADSDDW